MYRNEEAKQLNEMKRKICERMLNVFFLKLQVCAVWERNSIWKLCIFNLGCWADLCDLFTLSRAIVSLCCLVVLCCFGFAFNNLLLRVVAKNISKKCITLLHFLSSAWHRSRSRVRCIASHYRHAEYVQSAAESKIMRRLKWFSSYSRRYMIRFSQLLPYMWELLCAHFIMEMWQVGKNSDLNSEDCKHKTDTRVWVSQKSSIVTWIKVRFCLCWKYDGLLDGFFLYL